MSFKPCLHENNEKIYNDLFCGFSTVNVIGLLIVLTCDILIVIIDCIKFHSCGLGFKFFIIHKTNYCNLNLFLAR